MGLNRPSFITWTEKVRRRLLRSSGEHGRRIFESLPDGVPVSYLDTIEFLDILESSALPKDIMARVVRWRAKLCQTETSHDRNSQE